MLDRNLFILFLGISVSLPLMVASEQRKESRIFKGKYDTENHHKYHVAVLRLLPNDTTEHICGGAIIDSRYVLTAAHCVYGMEKNDLLVRSGWNKSPEQPALEKRSFHGVAKIMYLKDYHNTECRGHEHDIAILKVVRNFDLVDDESFKKVNLPEFDNDYEDSEAVFTGYGVERIGIIVNKTTKEPIGKKFKYPEELKYLETEVIPLVECKKDASVIVTNRNICTKPQNPNGFSCVGDSGGPLVHNGVVIGIRNSHKNECIHDQPELFTRVSSYLEFINRVLNQESSMDVVYL